MVQDRHAVWNKEKVCKGLTWRELPGEEMDISYLGNYPLLCENERTSIHIYHPQQAPEDTGGKEILLYLSIFSETLKLQISFFSLGLLFVAQIP